MYTKMEKERKESNIYKWTCEQTDKRITRKLLTALGSLQDGTLISKWTCEQTDKRITRKLLTTLGSLQDGTLISEPAVPLCVFWGALESSEL